ncbi:MAG: D-alanyl-D-alanine carboxypeptidase [bacterium]|nr:D-alanyl-D-alanine carboxypeptidase [bacterium]MDY4108584.1 D-alanyl-D-alanine carboxypeptidase family protein [Bacilli bacterium]
MKKFMLFLILLFVFITPISAEDLTLNAKSSILIEASTGKILYEKNKDERYAPASMTKMMSLVIIMDNIYNGNLRLDEMIKTSKNASGMGGSQIFLKEGEEMSVDDMLKGITIGSANDATVALAERIAGSEEAFVKIMNEYAKKLGLKNTHFKNCTGLDENDHYSSAYDMSVIARELVKHEKILNYSSIYETYLRSDTDNKFWLVNTNKLVRFYKGVDGLKTGYTDTAGYCLTATINKDNMRVIAVVMGEDSSTTRNSEVSGLLDYAYNLYKKDTYITKEEVLGNAKVEKGNVEYANIVTVDDISIINKKEYKRGEIKFELDLKYLKAPIKKGDVVGKIKVIENGNIISEADVTVDKNIDKAGYFTMFIRNLKEIISANV